MFTIIRDQVKPCLSKNLLVNLYIEKEEETHTRYQ